MYLSQISSEKRFLGRGTCAHGHILEVASWYYSHHWRDLNASSLGTPIHCQKLIWCSGGSRRGGTDLRRVHFSAKTNAKMKEMDPVGGGGGSRWWQPPWIHQCGDHSHSKKALCACRLVLSLYL